MKSVRLFVLLSLFTTSIGSYRIKSNVSIPLPRRYVSPYNGRMSSNGITKERVKVRDWDELEADFIDSPGVTLLDFAESNGILYDTLIQHARKATGDWNNKRNDHHRNVYRIASERIAGVIAETRLDDVSSFRHLEDRVKAVVYKSLELLFPPEDAPLDVQAKATARLEAMSADKLSNIINTSLRTLTETGRHRRLLSGQSTAIFARAELPDIELPIPLEEAKMLELRSRLAQQALNAIDNGQPLDVEFAVVESPEIAGDPDTVGSSAGSPGVRRHRD